MQMLYRAQTNLGGTATLVSFNPWKHYNNYSEQVFEGKSSDLPQWPIKLWQVPEVSSYFHHTHAPMEEMVALMKYMVGHNTAHAKELAYKLDEAGDHPAYHKQLPVLKRATKCWQKF